MHMHMVLACPTPTPPSHRNPGSAKSAEVSVGCCHQQCSKSLSFYLPPGKGPVSHAQGGNPELFYPAISLTSYT